MWQLSGNCEVSVQYLSSNCISALNNAKPSPTVASWRKPRENHTSARQPWRIYAKIFANVKIGFPRILRKKIRLACKALEIVRQLSSRTRKSKDGMAHKHHLLAHQRSANVLCSKSESNLKKQLILTVDGQNFAPPKRMHTVNINYINDTPNLPVPLLI